MDRARVSGVCVFGGSGSNAANCQPGHARVPRGVTVFAAPACRRLRLSALGGPMSTRDGMPAWAATGRDDLDAAAAAYIGDRTGAPATQRAALRAEFTRRCLPF